MLCVRDFMTGQPETIEAGASALAALDLMIDRDIRHLPVVDRGGRVRGVLSFDDLRAAFPFAVSLRTPPSAAERAIARDTCVGEIMTHDPRTALPDTLLSDAASRLARFRIGCLPVVDGEGRLLGMFSETDALRALIDTESAPSRATAPARQLEHLVAELRAERDRIAARIEHLQSAARTADESRDARREAVRLLADEPLIDLSAHRLDAIDRALARVTQGRFGSCTKCGADISVARLRALPDAALCVRCAAMPDPRREGALQ
jgi:CBS domain-containing membrane protein